VRRIGGIVALAVVCALLFVLPSAFARYHGAPRWLALAVGALAFPVIPVGWHLLAERRARKSALTKADRFLFRVLGVALIAIAPLVAIDRGGLWGAIKGHSLWWLDWTDPPAPRSPVSDPRMLDAVPGDAEGLIWSSSVAPLGEALLAIGPDAILVAIHDTPERLDALRTDDLAFLAKARGYSGVTTTRPAPDLMLVVSERWVDRVAERVAGGGARPKALIDRLRAPPGVTAAGVWREAVGWVLDDRAAVRVTMPDAARAETMRERLDAWTGEVVQATRGACAEDPGPVLEDVTVERRGVVVVIGATLHRDALVATLGCMLSPMRDSR
jgi:hypothetical protein